MAISFLIYSLTLLLHVMNSAHKAILAVFLVKRYRGLPSTLHTPEEAE